MPHADNGGIPNRKIAGILSPLIGFQPDAEEYENDLETYIDQMRKGEDIWQAEDFDKEYGSLVKKLATKRMKQYRDDVEKQIKAWEG